MRRYLPGLSGLGGDTRESVRGCLMEMGKPVREDRGLPWEQVVLLPFRDSLCSITATFNLKGLLVKY